MNLFFASFAVYDFSIEGNCVPSVNIIYSSLTLFSLLTFSSSVRPLREPEMQKNAARKHGAKHSCRGNGDERRRAQVHNKCSINEREVRINMNTLKQNVLHLNSNWTIKGWLKTIDEWKPRLLHCFLLLIPINKNYKVLLWYCRIVKWGSEMLYD